jgi:hypothetical protein
MSLIRIFFDNPYFKTKWPDGELHKPPIHANYNDSVATEMVSPGLAGCTDEDLGPITRIIVDAPLVLASEHLSIDLSATQAQLDALDTRVDALEATVGSHTTNIGSNLTAINAEITARAAADTTLANADTSLSARITTIELRIPTPLANFANDAAAASGGIAVGRFYRNGSVVMIRVA